MGIQKFYFLILFSFLLDINIFGTSDWTITTSGTYIIYDDIIASTGDATNGTININSSYVTLDLNGRFIQQTSSGGTAGALGIVVNSNLTDIIIKNGTVRNYLGSGVVVNSGCSRISLQNLIIESCALSGIKFAGTTSGNIQFSEIRNCKIFNCSNSSSATDTLWLLFCNFITVADIILDNNSFTNTTGNSIGVALDSSSSCSLSNISFLNATGGGGTSVLAPFLIQSGTSAAALSNVLENCKVINCSNNSGTGSLYGFYLTDNSSTNKCNFNVLNNCLVSTCTAASNFYGFYCHDTFCQSNVFNKCICIGNSTINGAFGGFEFDSSTTQHFCTDCICIGSTQSTASSAGLTLGGFKVEGGSTQISFVRPVAVDNVSTHTISAGVYIVNGTKCFTKEGFFSRNTGSSDQNSNGIRWDNGTYDVFSRCIAFGDGSTSSTTDIMGSGAFLTNSTTEGIAAALNSVADAWTNLRLPQ